MKNDITIYSALRQAARVYEPQDELIRKLGYHNPRKGKQALQKFINAGSLEKWLQSSLFDFVHAPVTFVRKLAQILDLASPRLEREIEAIQDQEVRKIRMPRPWIFVETHFRRRGEPIFALAMLEGKRRIALEKEQVFERPLPEVLGLVSRIVLEHYTQSGGKLPIWGSIDEYHYHHPDGSVYRFDPQGVPIDQTREPMDEARTTLTIRGRPIDFGDDVIDTDGKHIL